MHPRFSQAAEMTHDVIGAVPCSQIDRRRLEINSPRCQSRVSPPRRWRKQRRFPLLTLFAPVQHQPNAEVVFESRLSD